MILWFPWRRLGFCRCRSFRVEEICFSHRSIYSVQWEKSATEKIRSLFLPAATRSMPVRVAPAVYIVDAVRGCETSSSDTISHLSVNCCWDSVFCSLYTTSNSHRSFTSSSLDTSQINEFEFRAVLSIDLRFPCLTLYKIKFILPLVLHSTKIISTLRFPVQYARLKWFPVSISTTGRWSYSVWQSTDICNSATDYTIQSNIEVMKFYYSMERFSVLWLYFYLRFLRYYTEGNAA